jgi:hypothetical protein
MAGGLRPPHDTAQMGKKRRKGKDDKGYYLAFSLKMPQNGEK